MSALTPADVGDGRKDTTDPRTFLHNGKYVDPRTVNSPSMGGVTYGGEADENGYIKGTAPADAKPMYMSGYDPTKAASGGSSGGGSGTGSPTGSQGLVTGAQQAATTPWEVTAQQRVADQVEAITAKDGALMQQARGGAMQSMNERGLVNSTIATGAAQAAVIDKAQQIASQDANTAAQSAQFNANAKNAASMYNAGQKNQYDLAKEELDIKNKQVSFDNDYKTKQLSQQDKQFYDQLKVDVDKLNLSQDDAFNTQYRMYTEALANIDRDPNLGAEAKVVAKNSQKQILKDWVKLKGLNLDLNFLDNASGPGAGAGPGSGSGSGSGQGLVAGASGDSGGYGGEGGR